MRSGLFVFLLISLSVTLTYCDKDDEVPDKPSLLGIENGLLVLNEGNFLRANASVDLIDLTTNEVQRGVFEAANGVSPGDVAHSGLLFDSLFYLVVNNSGKIVAVSLQDFTVVKTIEGLRSPRYIQPISLSTAYVSDLYANQVYLVNLKSAKVIDSISVYGMTERMVMVDGKVFVANNKSTFISVLDPTLHKVIDSIDVGGFSNEIRQMDGDVLVLRNANSVESNHGAIVTISPKTNTVLKTVEFDSEVQMWYGRTSVDEGTLYFNLGNEILSYENGSITSLMTVENVGLNNFSVLEGSLWLADAKDFQQQGEIIQYDLNGKELMRFTTGIIPSSIIPVSF